MKNLKKLKTDELADQVRQSRAIEQAQESEEQAAARLFRGSQQRLELRNP